MISEVVISAPDDREGNEEVDEAPRGRVCAFWADAMERFGSEQEYNRKIVDAFKGPGDPDILIVVSKLLTGFDAPRNTVLYICKDMKEHTLLQAIARVNRLHTEGGESKKFGFIIDYQGLLGELDKALTAYAALEGYDQQDLAGAVVDVRKEIARLPDLHGRLWDIFREVGSKSDMEAMEQLLADDALRDEFYARLRTFSRCLHIALSSEEAYDVIPEDEIAGMRRDWGRFYELRRSVRIRYQEAVDAREFEPKIRALLDDHVSALPAETVVEVVDIHDSGLLRQVAEEQGTSAASRADRIASATRRIITENMERNPAFDERFSALLQQTIAGCGKTTTAREFAASEVLFDVDEDARRLAAADPAEVLKGLPPRLIDEWQLEPGVWNHVRRTVDDRRETGQFILTGSAIPGADATRHTGMRRMVRLQMRPLSLHEMGRSSGAISLTGLLAGDSSRAEKHAISIGEVAELICRGGWPESVDWPLSRVLRANRAQVDEVARVDVQGVDGVRRDPQRVRLLLRSLARNVGTAVATSKLAADLGGGGNGAIKPHTASAYLHALERIMIVENQPAWATHLRSRATLRKRPVRHFVDPSLAVAALEARPEMLLRDFRFLGLLFESLVVRDLRVYAQAADAEVYHYRENGRLEVDAAVQARDGRWAAFEVKLGPRMIDEGARNLLRLRQRVDPVAAGPPRALGVIVASGYGYTRRDGVDVIPTGALGP